MDIRNTLSKRYFKKDTSSRTVFAFCDSFCENCNIIAALKNYFYCALRKNNYLDKNYKYVRKNLVGVIILREEVENDIALYTALFPPWRRLKPQQSQWYLFHEPSRWLLPWFEPPKHYAASVRAIFRATEYSNKNLKYLVVLHI